MTSIKVHSLTAGASHTHSDDRSGPGRGMSLRAVISAALMSGQLQRLPRDMYGLKLSLEAHGELSLLGRIVHVDNKARLTSVVSFAVCCDPNVSARHWALLHDFSSEPVNTDRDGDPREDHWAAFTAHVPPRSMRWFPILAEAQKYVGELACAWIHRGAQHHGR